MTARPFKKGDRLFLMDMQNSRCEISNYHFARIRDFLSLNGYKNATDLNDADAILVNTCAGVDHIIELGEMFIGKVLDTTNGKPFFSIGCLGAISKVHSSQKNVITIPPKEMNKIGSSFQHNIPFSDVKPEYGVITEPYQININSGDQFVLISQGCVNACSYCNIKRVKGFVQSRSEKDIIDDVKRLMGKGYYVITLLSDDCGSFGNDRQTNLGDLITKLLSINEKLKLKIYTIHPTQLIDNYEKLKAPIAQKRISYIGVPVQSGCQRILKLMNRNYDPNDLKSILEEIKLIYPEIHLYSHFIFNFPTETMAEFEKSVEYSKLFDYCQINAFCENKHVKSYTINPKCTESEYERKLKILQEKANSGEISAMIGTNEQFHKPAKLDHTIELHQPENKLSKKNDNYLTIHKPEEVFSQIGIEMPAHKNR